MALYCNRCVKLVPVLFVLALAACDSGPGADSATASGRIEGSVVYRERMMLPPGAEVEAQLQDISRADALAMVMESVLLTPEGGPPYPFAIEYDARRIDPRKRYALRATISVNDRLMFTTTDYIDPFADTGGAPLEVLVRRVAEPDIMAN